MNFRIRKYSDHVFQILLSPPMDGFDHFICVWVYRGEETFIVDTGPAITAGDLLAALREIGLESPDYILLTHIHIDHAGGIGEISSAFPDAPVVCHEIARPHLIDPEKLWQGTLRTLGDTGRAYGEIRPVPEERLLNVQHFSAGTVKPILTPGHAPHHVSFITADGILFAGEAGGVSIDFHDTITYLRPATPPIFRLETSVSSLDRMINEQPESICYGHTAMKTNAAARLESHRDQLFFWKELIAEGTRFKNGEELIRHCADQLLKKDQRLKGLSFAAAPVFRREHFFLKNSIRGFIGYLDQSQPRPAPAETSAR